VTKAETHVAELGRKAVRLQFLKDEADTVGSSYKNVARRIEEVEVSIATGTKENNLFVIDHAFVPKLPVRPKQLTNVVLGTIIALLIAATFCLVLERLDQTSKGKEDAERILGYPLLGFVPRVELAEIPADADGAPTRIELVALREPRGS